jgi:hypothetical protein
MTSPSTLPSSLGNIDATLHNLERAVLVNYSKLSDGRPTITLLGQTAQSPYPELVLTTELIENLNQIALGAMVKCTKALIEAQLAVMDKLIAEREALPDDWTPTPEGLEAASKITKLKSFKSTTFVSKPIPGGVQTFLHPEDGVSMTSIQHRFPPRFTRRGWSTDGTSTPQRRRKWEPGWSSPTITTQVTHPRPTGYSSTPTNRGTSGSTIVLASARSSEADTPPISAKLPNKMPSLEVSFSRPSLPIWDALSLSRGYSTLARGN